MRYNEKSLEEVLPILEAYQRAFEARNGIPPNIQELRLKLESMALEKEKQAFHNAFEHLSPASLRLAIKAITINPPEPTPTPKDQVQADEMNPKKQKKGMFR